jgi:hypothetical protein
MTVNYKSTRLLVEATNKAMDAVRKAAMGNIPLPWDDLNELRDLVAQLAKKADRVAVEDVSDMAPADYVATMKPLVADYHRQLAARDLLAPCLCMDLRIAGCVLILVGDGTTSVRTAHDPGRPEAALVVEAILASLDAGSKQLVSDAATVIGVDDRVPLNGPITEEDASMADLKPLPCQGEHDEPCGASDCYVLESIRRVKRKNEEEEGAP